MKRILAITLCLLLNACSSQQAFNAASTWQRNECNKITESTQRQKCMDGVNTSYDDYKRQSETDVKK
jgi:uncharacterized protein YxeA